MPLLFSVLLVVLAMRWISQQEVKLLVERYGQSLSSVAVVLDSLTGFGLTSLMAVGAEMTTAITCSRARRTYALDIVSSFRRIMAVFPLWCSVALLRVLANLVC